MYIIACYILSYHIIISYYTMFHYFILCVCCIYTRFFILNLITHILVSCIILWCYTLHTLLFTILLFFCYENNLLSFTTTPLLSLLFWGCLWTPVGFSSPLKKRVPVISGPTFVQQKGTDFDASWWVSCGFWIPDSARFSCLSCEGWGLVLIGNHLRVSYLAMRI